MFDKIRYFGEISCWLKIWNLLPTTLAAVTELADGLALAQ